MLDENGFYQIPHHINNSTWRFRGDYIVLDGLDLDHYRHPPQDRSSNYLSNITYEADACNAMLRWEHDLNNTNLNTMSKANLTVFYLVNESGIAGHYTGGGRAWVTNYGVFVFHTFYRLSTTGDVMLEVEYVGRGPWLETPIPSEIYGPGFIGSADYLGWIESHHD